jgi:hypothetical protein
VSHELRYEPRSQGGQNWSGADAGYRAVCSCGDWACEEIVQRPPDPRSRQRAEEAHLVHRVEAD